MKRLGLVDRAFIFTLVPIWAFWFGIYLNNLARGRVADIPLDVSVPQGPDDYPTLLGFRDRVPPGGPWEGLEAGDRLLKVGQTDLRGVWPVGFHARVYKETDTALHLPLVFMRAGHRYETLLSLKTDPFPWVWAVINVSFVGLAMLLILRRPNSRLIRAIFLMTMVLSMRFTPFAPGVRAAPLVLTYMMAVDDFVTALIVLPLVLLIPYLFLEEAIRANAYLPKWPWLFAVAGPIWCAWMVGIALVGQRLDSYLRPESCVTYGRSGDTYAPLFFRGRAVAPTINAGAGLVTTLQSETRSVEVERWLRRRAPGLSSSDRAVLDSLGAAALAPMHRGDLLEAFICLGQKRSGDIYTVTDLTLLTAVAERVSAELRRFDDAELARQVRTMSDSLRRYVPEQIAAQVVSGQDLDARESEVSVLFVDLRGYTTYAEDKSAAEVFSTVNRYTETVSRVVRAHGGTVVEFNGDGMMAVFGAPAPLAQKERAAVAASREIVFSVRSLELGVHREQPLEVGVGIATGKAFVGNIQSIDRLIWSAIGDTSNLAARLQGLTRELNAAIVIDSATRMKAGTVADDFERHDSMPIRGRRQSEDVYSLPLRAEVFTTSAHPAG